MQETAPGPGLAPPVNRSPLKRIRVMKKLFSEFIHDDTGVTAIEYGLIAALVAVAAVSAFTALGGQLASVFTGVSGKMTVPT